MEIQGTTEGEGKPLWWAVGQAIWHPSVSRRQRTTKRGQGQGDPLGNGSSRATTYQFRSGGSTLDHHLSVRVGEPPKLQDPGDDFVADENCDGIVAQDLETEANIGELTGALEKEGEMEEGHGSQIIAASFLTSNSGGGGGGAEGTNHEAN